MREEYEIWRTVGLGIAVAGIRGVAGLGGRMRAYGWDWGRWVASLANSGGHRQFCVPLILFGRAKAATITISGDFPLDAGLGPACPSKQDC